MYVAIRIPGEKTGVVSYLNCVHCGAEISERQEICTLCGKYARVADPVPKEPEPPVQAPAATKPEQTSTATLEKRRDAGDYEKDPLGGLTPEEYFDKVMGTDNTSGRGTPGALPAELRGWNWGAFFFTWIWGIGNNTWIAFLSWIPYVGMVMPFVLGFKGNEWAWKNKRWNNIAHFKRIQRNWAIAGVIYSIALIGLIVLVFVLLSSAASLQQAAQTP